jgi:hypothetical protein
LFSLLERLKVFALAFECWSFLLFHLNVEGSCSYFECWSFLLFHLNVKGFCSYFWMLKVFTFTFWC